jgi:hypothetical protein
LLRELLPPFSTGEEIDLEREVRKEGFCIPERSFRTGKSSTDISIARLKHWVFQTLPRESKLRELILSEKEVLTVGEFVTKLETWLLLAANDRAE